MVIIHNTNLNYCLFRLLLGFNVYITWPSAVSGYAIR